MPATVHTAASCGPTMPALLRMRFRAHLRVAIDCWRLGERDRAWFHLGVADGCVSALYDTVVWAWPYKQKVNRVRAVMEAHLAWEQS
jgi:hypothetical protein